MEKGHGLRKNITHETRVTVTNDLSFTYISSSCVF